MIKGKRAALAALLAVSLMTGALLTGCGGGSIQASSTAGGPPSDQENAGQQSDDPGRAPAGAAAPKTDENADQTDPSDAGGSGAAERTDGGRGDGAQATGAPKAPGTDAGGTEDAQPQKSSADDSYFDDALFIGDSLTEGFQLHGGITNATYYGFKNLNVKEVFSKPLVRSGGGKITIADAIRKNSFGKYYIMLGANELGWVYPEVFTEKYGELIDLIRQVNPEAKIYLQSVLPVSEETSRTSKIYSNDRIDYYDELISALAAEKGVTYLNVREAVENENGVLPDEAATDGVHLNKDYCLKWADYLRQNQ